MKIADAQRLTRYDQWFRFWMPYTFTKLEVDGKKHVYLPLNRNYKPLGNVTDDWVKYEDYESQAIIFGADPMTFKNVWIDDTGLWLYTDSSRSRLTYFERLGRLMCRSVRLVGKTPG